MFNRFGLLWFFCLCAFMPAAQAETVVQRKAEMTGADTVCYLFGPNQAAQAQACHVRTGGGKMLRMIEVSTAGGAEYWFGMNLDNGWVKYHFRPSAGAEEEIGEALFYHRDAAALRPDKPIAPARLRLDDMRPSRLGRLNCFKNRFPAARSINICYQPIRKDRRDDAQNRPENL